MSNPDDEQPFVVTNYMTGQTYSIAYCGEGEVDDDLEDLIRTLPSHGFCVGIEGLVRIEEEVERRRERKREQARIRRRRRGEADASSEAERHGWFISVSDEASDVGNDGYVENHSPSLRTWSLSGMSTPRKRRKRSERQREGNKSKGTKSGGKMEAVAKQQQQQQQQETEGQEDAYSGDDMSSSAAHTERGDDNVDAFVKVDGDTFSREDDDGDETNSLSVFGSCYGDAESQLPSLLRQYLHLSRRPDGAASTAPSRYPTFNQELSGDGASGQKLGQRHEEDDTVDYLTDDNENESLATQEAEVTDCGSDVSLKGCLRGDTENGQQSDCNAAAADASQLGDGSKNEANAEGISEALQIRVDHAGDAATINSEEARAARMDAEGVQCDKGCDGLGTEIITKMSLDDAVFGANLDWFEGDGDSKEEEVEVFFEAAALELDAAAVAEDSGGRNDADAARARGGEDRNRPLPPEGETNACAVLEKRSAALHHRKRPRQSCVGKPPLRFSVRENGRFKERMKIRRTAKAANDEASTTLSCARDIDIQDNGGSGEKEMGRKTSASNPASDSCIGPQGQPPSSCSSTRASSASPSLPPWVVVGRWVWVEARHGPYVNDPGGQGRITGVHYRHTGSEGTEQAERDNDSKCKAVVSVKYPETAGRRKDVLVEIEHVRDYHKFDPEMREDVDGGGTRMKLRQRSAAEDYMARLPGFITEGARMRAMRTIAGSIRNGDKARHFAAVLFDRSMAAQVGGKGTRRASAAAEDSDISCLSRACVQIATEIHSEVPIRYFPRDSRAKRITAFVEEVCNAFSFDFATPYQFVKRFTSAAGNDDVRKSGLLDMQRERVLGLLELAQFVYQLYVVTKPCLLAASAVYLSREEMHSVEAWPRGMIDATQYDEKELSPVVQSLRKHLMIRLQKGQSVRGWISNDVDKTS